MENIKKLIEKSPKTKKNIADDAGIEHSTIYRIFNGDRKSINLDTAFKLADALEVDINEFREEDSE